MTDQDFGNQLTTMEQTVKELQRYGWGLVQQRDRLRLGVHTALMMVETHEELRRERLAAVLKEALREP